VYGMPTANPESVRAGNAVSEHGSYRDHARIKLTG
jgi:hypothetical protein